MKYNFDEIIDRKNNYSAKLEEMHLHYKSDDAIPLWIADMDFRTAPEIVHAIKSRADDGIFGYTWRTPKYFESINNWQKKRNNFEFPIENMAFAPGVVPAIRMTILNFSSKTDKVLIQQPVYHPFTDVVENTGRTLVINPLKRDEGGYYTMDLEDFEEKAKKGIKYFILCNPHNPVGRAWTKEELKSVGDICVKYNIEILSDEIHSDLILDGHKHIPMASVSKSIEKITTTYIAPSKTFNLAGLQSSTVIFNTKEKVDTYVSELKKMDIARNNCFSLVATMAAYNHSEDWLDELLIYISDNMKFINDFCEKNLPLLKPNRPEATYLCWIDARKLNMEDEQLQRFFVDKARVALGKGTDFGIGGSGFVRLNAATSRITIKKALEQIKEACLML